MVVRSPTLRSDYRRLRGGLSIVNLLETTFLSGIPARPPRTSRSVGSVDESANWRRPDSASVATNLTITSSVQACGSESPTTRCCIRSATGGTFPSAHCNGGRFFRVLLGFSTSCSSVSCPRLSRQHPHGRSRLRKDALRSRSTPPGGW